MFAIIAELKVRASHRQALAQALTADGEGALRDEPGTLRFDVYEDAEEPGRFILVEVYADQAAFDAHMNGAAFAAAAPVLESLRNEGLLTSRRIANVDGVFFARAASWQIQAGSVSA